MADAKITALTATTTAALADLLAIVTDVSTTAATKKITVSNFLTSLIALWTTANTFAITNATSTVTLSTQEYIRCNGTFAVNCYAATGSGKGHLIKNIGVGTITITPSGIETIDGGPTYDLLAGDRVTIIDAASGAWDVV